jgi:chaperonin cofactor prefoldin
MSALGDLFAGIRKVLVLEQRLDSLSREVERLTAAHTDTRERLIRLEVIIDEARRTAAARGGASPRLSPDR